MLMLGALVLTYSCDLVGPIDEIEPFYKLTEENIFSDATKCEASLNGVYAAWRGTGIASYTSSTLMLSGNYEPLAPGASGSDLFENMADMEDYYLGVYYSDYYDMIQRANFLIEGMQSDLVIPGLSDERRVEIEAEARLHRAFAHFFLLRNFGQFYDQTSELGIVLRSEPVRKATDYPRSTVEQAYDLILSDIDYAIDNAPIFAESGFLTSWAAKALKAKVLLYTTDWEEAATLALEVINSGVYELKTDFRDLYAEGYKSMEVIFSPISIAISSYVPYTGSSYNNPGQLLKAIADLSVGGPSDGDILMGTGYDPRFAYAHAALMLPLGVYNNKYPFQKVDGEQTNSHFVLRLGEMYLIYAEAQARLAAGTNVDAGALQKLNDIRNRAGLLDLSPATKAELLEAIRIEKTLELFGEFNEPWFDMVRYHILGDINISDIRPNITSNDQLILPFPVKALSGNGALLQNPGYLSF